MHNRDINRVLGINAGRFRRLLVASLAYFIVGEVQHGVCDMLQTIVGCAGRDGNKGRLCRVVNIKSTCHGDNTMSNVPEFPNRNDRGENENELNEVHILESPVSLDGTGCSDPSDAVNAESKGLLISDREADNIVDTVIEQLLFESGKRKRKQSSHLGHDLKIGGLTRTVREWAAIAKLRPGTVRKRLLRGKSPLEALMTNDGNGNYLRTCGNEEADAILREERNQPAAYVRWHGRNTVLFRIVGDVAAQMGFTDGERVAVVVSQNFPGKLLIVKASFLIANGYTPRWSRATSNPIVFHRTYSAEMIDILFRQKLRTAFRPRVSIVVIGERGTKAIALDCSEVWPALEAHLFSQHENGKDAEGGQDNQDDNRLNAAEVVQEVEIHEGTAQSANKS